jgi:membrane associated rhomboid family serine protease
MSEPLENGDGDDAVGIWELTTLVRAVGERPWVAYDVLFLFVIPAVVLIGIHLTTVPALFEYDIDNPTLWGIYMSNFSHRSWLHLGSNLIGLLIIGGSEYILLTASGYRAHYIAVFLGSILVFPPLSHLLLQFLLANQPALQTYEAVGFSEPLAALVGYYPLAVATYHTQVSDFQLPVVYTILLSTGGMAWGLIQHSALTLRMALLTLCGVGGISSLAYHLYTTDSVTTSLQRGRYALTSALCHVIYLFALVGLFRGSIGGFIGHLGGYLPGFGVTLLCTAILAVVAPEHDYTALNE